MSLFRGGREQRLDSPTNSLIELLQRRMSPTLAGASVTADTAMSHSAVHQCVDLIADLVSGFPPDVYRDIDGYPELVTERRAIIDQPSAEVDPLNWRRLVVVCWLLRGNAYGLVTGTYRGLQPKGIELIHPDRVSVERMRPDQPAQFLLDRKPIDRWPLGPLWHAPGKALQPGSPLGVSILEHAMNAIGLGLSVTKFGSQFFNSGGIPTALLMNEKPVNEDGAKRVKGRFLDAMAGTREPAVFGDGWKYQQVSISPNESQFLETIKANKADVAGFFNIPPELIGAPSGSNMTYSNVESRGIDLLRFCINGWTTRMDNSLSGLLVRPEYVHCDVDELLRADTLTRYTALDMGIRGGWLSVNEARRREQYKPIDDGDLYLWPPYAVKDQATKADAQVDATAGAAP